MRRERIVSEKKESFWKNKYTLSWAIIGGLYGLIASFLIITDLYSSENYFLRLLFIVFTPCYAVFIATSTVTINFTNAVYISSFLMTVVFFVFVGFFMGCIITNFKRINEKKAIFILTFLFLFSLFLGMIGIPPFGKYETIGDVIMPTPTQITKIPIYPLIVGLTFLEKSNFFNEKLTIIYLVIGLIILIFYYYLLSTLIVHFYLKMKEELRK